MTSSKMPIPLNIQYSAEDGTLTCEDPSSRKPGRPERRFMSAVARKTKDVKIMEKLGEIEHLDQERALLLDQMHQLQAQLPEKTSFASALDRIKLGANIANIPASAEAPQMPPSEHAKTQIQIQTQTETNTNNDNDRDNDRDKNKERSAMENISSKVETFTESKDENVNTAENSADMTPKHIMSDAPADSAETTKTTEGNAVQEEPAEVQAADADNSDHDDNRNDGDGNDDNDKHDNSSDKHDNGSDNHDDGNENDNYNDNELRIKALLHPFEVLDCQDALWEDAGISAAASRFLGALRHGKMLERSWEKRSDEYDQIINQYASILNDVDLHAPGTAELDGRKVTDEQIQQLNLTLKNIASRKKKLLRLLSQNDSNNAKLTDLMQSAAQIAEEKIHLDSLLKALPPLVAALPRLPVSKETEPESAVGEEVKAGDSGVDAGYSKKDYEEMISQLDKEIVEKNALIQKLKNKSTPPVPAGQLCEKGLKYLHDYFSVKECHIRNLEQALRLLEILWGDRVEVLKSAHDSAREAALFRDPGKAFRMMIRLVTHYLNDMRAGKGMGTAKKHFNNNEFASDECDKVPNSKRTFEGILMREHLRIGNNKSADLGWRCHFHYDPKTGKIIIGHCGKHLDFK